MKSFATSICPIKKSSRSEYEALGGSPKQSPGHSRAIPAWRTIPQPISKRFLSGVITGLRHVDLAYRCFRAISAWRSSHLSALRHGDPVYRHLRAISTWQSVLLSGIRHDKLVHRYPRGIILWRSQTGHLPLLIHEIGFFHGR